MKECSLKTLVSPYDMDEPIDWGAIFKRQASLNVEIGFGMGEVLMRNAQDFPDRNFVGIEQHWERIYKTLRAMTIKTDKQGACFDNVRILRVDARIVFERLFSSGTIDNIYCLFPCPWPKKSHIKHRLFTTSFLCLLNNRLKEKGQLKIVTDFHPFFEWVLEQSGSTGFKVKTKIIQPQYDTKFERKWLLEGKKDFFEIVMTKKEHCFVPEKRRVVLKGYSLENFDWKKFDFTNKTDGDVSVVFKEMLYDEYKKEAMVRVIVSEKDLIQHLWVKVVKKEKFWRVCKADGQNFFATNAIACAIELVYKAAVESGEVNIK